MQALPSHLVAGSLLVERLYGKKACYLTRGAHHSLGVKLHAGQQTMAPGRQLCRSQLSPQALEQGCMVWEE